MDFGTRPPEINAGLLFSGPGSGSMTSAATAWEELAAQLHDVAAACHRAAAKTHAAATYPEWLEATAARARQAATQAKAATRAYQSALAAAAPPPVIGANRMAWVSLARANCLGQSAPAIADTEADYERMWVQNADVMHAYARASANAAAVAPFASPPGTAAPESHRGRVSWNLRAAPDVISAGHPVMSTIPRALRALSSSPLASFDASLAPATASLSKLSSLSAPTDFALKHLNSLNKEAALCRAAALRVHWTTICRAGGAADTAAMGRATRIGGLPVPRGWVTEATRGQVAAAWRTGESIRLVQAGKPPSHPLIR